MRNPWVAWGLFFYNAYQNKTKRFVLVLKQVLGKDVEDDVGSEKSNQPSSLSKWQRQANRMFRYVMKHINMLQPHCKVGMGPNLVTPSNIQSAFKKTKPKG